MGSRREEKKLEAIEKLAEMLHKRTRGKDLGDLEAFARCFCSGMAPDDLIEHSLPDLYGAILTIWRYLKQARSGSMPKIRVYNPNVEEHGWQSTHTIVHIITDNMPFLVDSLRMELNRQGLTLHLVVHPVLHTNRDKKGHFKGFECAPAEGDLCVPEALLHIEVDRQTDEQVLQTLAKDLEGVLADVHVAVRDWQAMRDRALAICKEFEAQPPPAPVEKVEVDETVAFLRWIAADHFVFLGFRTYDLVSSKESNRLVAVKKSGLGIAWEGEKRPLRGDVALPAEVEDCLLISDLLTLTKSNLQSTMHRPGYMDFVGLRRLDAKAKVIGEYRFFGLYSSAAYNRGPREIPVLRRKVEDVMQRAGFPAAGHGGKALLNILENYPRDELFQCPAETLYRHALGIVQLQERQRVRLFVRRDPFRRFFACLVYTPRDRYDTEVRKRMQGVLKKAFCATLVSFSVQLSESVLARVYFVVHTEGGRAQPEPEYDTAEIEVQLAEVIRSWGEELKAALLENLGEERGNRLYSRYREAFPAAYREEFSARIAVRDIEHIEDLCSEEGAAIHSDNALGMSLYRPLEAGEDVLRFKLFHRGRAPSLSDTLPKLENMGVKVMDERPYELQPEDMPPIWIHDFGMAIGGGRGQDAEQLRDLFQDTFARVWSGEVDNDGFNQLVLTARLDWRKIVLLRAYAKYLRQTGLLFSQNYVEETLAAHADIACYLVDAFYLRFNPKQAKDAAVQVEALFAKINSALDRVASLDQDRILRGYLSLVEATVRTNYFQKEAGQPKAYLSLKFDPSKILELPLPRPMFEIFVYSPRIEGVHLRGGKVARGGLRWSDRREDYRTEVLGLMKAQMVKNALIVPMGAKGGFVVKRLPNGSREVQMAEVTACYRNFIRGLLDLTDNRVGARTESPQDLVRHDADDSYLVVAADKGTATFSDIANEVAKEYNFWLGDAFASGGSVGYDHKKMGITAKGAWESVKRHFREIGKDTQQSEFTVVGIGDMSGDVFGNGMLLSPHICLLAAFDHRHIFIDPSPVAKTSFAERARIFQLPRSSWADYDVKLISTGGGIYPRTAKSIRLSAQAQKSLGIQTETLTPTALIKNLLKTPADLIWNGGIGTYIKSSMESHADVGDRVNDGVRINGGEMRCQVFGEGGNLGITQRGRIEFALQGGYINTDSIDNAGGVHCSDQEVNIKILLGQIVAAGDMTEKQRNKLLAQMTEEVGQLVLIENYWQTQAISQDAARAAVLLHEHQRFIHQLERNKLLDRALESLPGDDEFVERQAAHLGLTRPELAVLLAYAKNTVYQALLESDVPEGPFLSHELERYFPTPLRERFRTQMRDHRLRREITATFVTNRLVNRMGCTAVFRIQEESDAPIADIVRAYSVAWEVFHVRDLWQKIAELDNQVPAELQTAMLFEGGRLVERTTLWMLRNRQSPLDISESVAYFLEGITAIHTRLVDILKRADVDLLQNAQDRFKRSAVPEELGRKIACLDILYSCLDIVEAAKQTGLPVIFVAELYFRLGARLELRWLREQITSLSVDNRWQVRARRAMFDEVYSAQSNATLRILEYAGKGQDKVDAAIDRWVEKHPIAVQRCQHTFADIRAGGSMEFATLSVALRELRALGQAD